MKKLVFFISFTFLFTHSYAQTIPDSITTRQIDSLKARRLKGNKIQVAGGIKMGSNNDIFENLQSNPQFATLVKAMRVAGLPLTFKSNGPITLFAPIDDAFKKLPKGKLDTLLKKRHILDMSALLTCHAVPGKLTIDDIKDQITQNKGKAKFITLGGNEIFATMDGKDVILTDELGNKSMIQAGDFRQYNGLIHVINGILLPKPKAI